MDARAESIAKAVAIGCVGAVTGVVTYVIVKKLGLGGVAGAGAAGFVGGFVGTLLRKVMNFG